MTQRIGTGANSEIDTYAVTLDTTPRQLESSRPVGSVLGGGLTVRAPSATVALALNAGPINTGRFYVQGAIVYNNDNAITIYVAKSASHTATTAFPIPPGKWLRLDMNRLDNVFIFAASGTPVAKICAV